MLYLITNRKLIKSGNLYSVVLEALRGGTEAVILREKDLAYKELLPIVFKLRNITNSFSAQLIINGNLKSAIISNANFFHIGIKDFENHKPDLNGVLFGLSVHSVKEAIDAEKYGAKYILASHIFETDCKKGLKPKGINLIKNIKSKVNIPVIALGGINEKNIRDIIKAGADGVAVMSYIMSSLDPYSSARKLSEKVKSI
ncbi:thiamine phosphate synthase [Maledivibacter halophilus]|uniref:Thiamine-phosphate pyrophosphorylase n=1 Tax=Maledivibacter halophilus TaxID=36842 RepID=A0A1T5M110_9FIRM|nr:thiamine phosphate synthase [Maledivibacter halophilus]SKC81793.1 thiamine-phosphate pyrophosphorylase [Maledivibacter halophilus]